MPSQDTAPERKCLRCGKPTRERRSRYCSRECRDEAARTPARTCKGCGKLFRPRLDRRQYCSAECAAVATGPQRRKSVQLKACAVCGCLMERRAHETPFAYQRRNTCSRTCQSALQAATARTHPPTKTCVVCGKAFSRKPNEQADNFNRKKVCSEACRIAAGAQTRRKRLPAKTCVVCGKTFQRRKDELPCDFRKRRACSRQCGFKLAGKIRSERSNRRGPYPVIFNEELKEQIRERDGHRCRLCGAERGKRNLHIHHINYDKQDCRESNLISLCASCHCKTHTHRDHWRDVFTHLMDQ